MLKLISLNKIALSLFITVIYFLQCVYAAPLSPNPIAYTDIGKGVPLVLIHAFPTDQALWQPQQATLKDHFRVITLDLWGFGKSKAVNGQAITMLEYANEVNQLLNKLRIDQAIIGGESMGGYIALAFLQHYPEKVKGLILANTQSIADSAEARAKRETNALDVLQNGTATFINNFLPKALSKEAPATICQQLKNILDRQSAFALASALRGMALRDDLSLLLSATSKPILIITSDQDSLISPKQSEMMHTLAKNSKLVIIPNAGHLANLEKPQDWNQAVIDFYKSI
jgi:pimeloyl-ACP methyl ester carboxylesterase